uniref:Ig-like domain-containing protein n=1 Tax=Dicentrarchus labrax TaxID=13489 RepID=A0A8C4H1K6_DICLA
KHSVQSFCVCSLHLLVLISLNNFFSLDVYCWFLEQHVISVKPGDDVTLSCSAGDDSIRAVEWTRPDLEPEYVLFYRNKRSVTTNQHPSFKGRVNLADGEMKDGNVSLVINNVSISDNGTYECRVVTGGSSRHKRAIIDTDPIRTIQLEVTASGELVEFRVILRVKHEGYRRRNGFSVVVGMVLWKKKRHTDSNSEPAADEAVGDQLL